MSRYDQEQTLGELMADFWRARKFVAAGLVMGAVVACAFLFTALPHKKAQLLIAPAVSLDAQSTSAVSSGAGERANTAQAQGRSGDVFFMRFLASYKGAAAAKVLLQDDKIRAGLLRDRAFVFSRPPFEAREMSAPALAAYIGKRVELEQIGETPMRKLSYSHIDPAFAVYFLNRLHEVSDGLIRRATRVEIAERIAYVRGELSRISNPEHARAFTSLLMEQERLRMLVSIDQPYAASVVEPAYSGARKSWPSAGLVLAVCLGLGALSGYAAYAFKTAGRAQAGQQRRSGMSAKKIRSMREWIRKGRYDNSNQGPVSKRSLSSDAAE